jgi:uncharacterized membrane protein
MQSTPSVMQSQTNVFEFVKDQLGADPTQSKKFLMALVAICAIVICFIIAAVLFYLKAELAPHLVAICTILIPSIAGVASVYLGAQGAVEVKANGVLQHQAQELASKL